MNVGDVPVPLRYLMVQDRGEHPFRNVEDDKLTTTAGSFVAALLVFPGLVDKAKTRARHLIIPFNGVNGSVKLNGATQSYLHRIYDGLIDEDEIVACAARTAFTLFARQATTILHIRLARSGRIGEFQELGVPQKFGSYDRTEVARLLDSDRRGQFLQRYEQFFKISLSWSRAITYLPAQEQRHGA
jgi:hypothetical protein